MEIPKKGKAGVLVNEGPAFHLEVQEVDVPEPGPSELLLKLNCTGLCGPDIHFMLGDLGMEMKDFGVGSAGHEGAGVVAKLGPNVAGWSVGDRAGIKPSTTVCHNCEQCWNGSEQYCAQAIQMGVMKPGSYQQYVISPAIYTSRIPEGVPDEVAGPIMCVQLAKAMGMRPIVVDSGESKNKLALHFGAEKFLDFREEKDVPAKIKEIADGLEAHGVVVTAWQSYKNAISYIGDRVGGKVMCIGLPPNDQNVIMGDSPTHMALKRLSISGSIVGTMQDVAAALEYARRGLLEPIHKVRGLSDWPEAVQQLKRGEITGRVVIGFSKP